MTMLKNIIKLIRVKQWIKNFFIFLPLIFSGEFTELNLIIKSLIAFFAFSFAASSAYILNDLKDAESDVKHPKKKFRPIAAGTISKLEAKILYVLFFGSAVGLGILISWYLVSIVVVYLALNILYSFYLKNVPIIDLLALSLFYVIRVIAGAVTIAVLPSSWILLVTFFASLFLGAGKRYSELTNVGTGSRKVLENYSIEFLSYMLTLSSFSTILFYAIYTTTKNFYFELSIVFVVTGFLIYFFNLYRNNIAEDPVALLLKNKYLILCLGIWLIYMIIIIGFGEDLPQDFILTS